MIHMKMREQHIIDVRGPNPESLRPLDERIVQSIEVRRIGAILPIAGPSIDQGGPAWLLDDRTVNAQQDMLLWLIHGAQKQPVRILGKDTCVPIRK